MELARAHDLSARLASAPALAALVAISPIGLASARRVDGGLVEIALHVDAGRAEEDAHYAGREWRLRIGGAGNTAAPSLSFLSE